jgi:hypothetical protein
VSQQLPPDVRHVLLVADLALAALFCCLPAIERWWKRSYAVLDFRAHARVIRRYLAHPFRPLHRRPSKPTATVGVSPTPAVVVPHDVEVSCDDDQ